MCIYRLYSITNMLLLCCHVLFQLMACETLRWILRWDFTVLCHSRLIALSEFEYPSSCALQPLWQYCFCFCFCFRFRFFFTFCHRAFRRCRFCNRTCREWPKQLATVWQHCSPKSRSARRSAAEAQSNLSRTLGAPFELVRSGSGFSWSSAATACGLSCAKASK